VTLHDSRQNEPDAPSVSITSSAVVQVQEALEENKYLKNLLFDAMGGFGVSDTEFPLTLYGSPILQKSGYL
jgi:hypothetical protein